MVKERSTQGTVAQMLNALSRVECGLPTAGIGQMKREGKIIITPAFILPRKMIRAEWHKSFSLDEIYKSKFERPKPIPAPDNNFENINYVI